MPPQSLTRLIGLSSALFLAACTQNAAPGQQPVTAAPVPAMQPPSAPQMPTTPPPNTPATLTPTPAAMPPAPMPAPAQPPPAAQPPSMPAPTVGGAGAMPPTMMPSTMAPAAAVKQYSFDEIVALKRDDLIKAWSEAPATEVWVGCSGKYTELKHAADGTPMAMIPPGPPTWGGKCIPTDTKILYNIVDDKPTMPGGAQTATGPAVVKESFIDKKPAVVVVYQGGYELHFRNMGDKLWVGRQTANGSPSGTWYPLGDITGDGMRK